MSSLWACRADEVISSSDENVVARVKEITGRKMAYAAVDCVAGEMTDTVAASTREGGTVYVCMQLPVQAVEHSPVLCLVAGQLAITQGTC